MQNTKYDPVTPTLRELGILYKIFIVTYKALHVQAPLYLSTSILNKMCTFYSLRSDDNKYLLQTQQTYLACGLPGILLYFPERKEQISIQRSIFRKLRYIQDKAENARF